MWGWGGEGKILGRLFEFRVSAAGRVRRVGSGGALSAWGRH